MSDKKKFPWKKYLITTCVGLAITVIPFATRNFDIDPTLKDWMHVLHDGYFAAGMLLMLFVGLLYVSSEGAFLGIGYAMRRVAQSLLPFVKKEHETYAQYRERKTGQEKKKGDGAIFFVGLIFFALSLVFLLIWMQL